jgi:hypothetical protein
MRDVRLVSCAYRVVGVALAVILPTAGCGAPARTEKAVALAPLTTQGMLTLPHDMGGVKLFDPITPYALAKHAPQVEYAPYPVDYPADWTHWGTGCLHSNGRIYTTIGDHGATDADSCLYEFDPAARRLRRVGHLQAAVQDFKGGDYGFGKVHGRIFEGGDRKLYFASWWGKESDSPRYRGDRIFCFDPSSGEMTDLGVTIPGFGAPVTALDARRLIFYGEFGNPAEDTTDFVAYDLRERRVLFRGGHQGDKTPGRGILVDGEGCAYFDCRGTVRKYDPRTNSVGELPDRLPHKKFRQHASRLRPDGTIYATTAADQSALVVLDPKGGHVKTVATLWGNAKAMDADPTGRWIYYVPDCPVGIEPDEEDLKKLSDPNHLVAGLPVVQVDLANGASQKVIAFLAAPLKAAIGWETRGENTCYGLIVADDGRTLYITLNGFRPCDLGLYHPTPLFLVVHIPPQEIPEQPPAK